MQTTRIQEAILWFLGLALTVSVIMVAALPFEDWRETDGSRRPASVSKAPFIQGHELLRKQGKGSGLVEVTIRSSQDGPASAGQPFELEAEIETRSAVDDLRFAWLLPEGVTATSGALDGSLGNVQVGEKLKVTGTFVSESGDNRQIHLHVFKMTNGEAMGQMAQFNTVDREKLVEEVKEKSRFFLGSGNEQQKVMQ